MRARKLSESGRVVLREARCKRWRSLARQQGLSKAGQERLEWMIFYHTVGQRNARRTAAYFGISAKTFHKWKGRFSPRHLEQLEDQSRAPLRRRSWEVTDSQQARVKRLRRRYPKYGKAKLKILYQEIYHEPISTWKIERVIRHFQLYPDPERVAKRARRQRREPKPRIHQVQDLSEPLLWHIDTIRVDWYGLRRYIFTAIEHRARLGFAHIYPRCSSRQATDFLNRLLLLSEGYLPRIHSDNGSEFAGEFDKACRRLGIQHLFSRLHHPKDNPRLERFNGTLQDEWLAVSQVGLDEIDEGNLDLTHWLIEYNAHRPHHSLAFMTPLSYALSQNVLPMSPAKTAS
jgi:transposase InsO family protein